MRVCVIGIHSDCIVMEIREQCDLNYITLIQEKETILLANYLSPDGLTLQGQELLLETLEHMLSYAKKLICDHIFAFSTSILRYASNRDAILNKLKTRLHLSVKILTGANQAALSCSEISNSIGTRSGLGCQIGGGSTQLFLLRNSQIQDFISIPIGHAMLYNRNVSSVLPTTTESQNIKHTVIDAIKDYPFPQNQSHRTIYMMGECCENISKLHLSATGNLLPDLSQMHNNSTSININDYSLLLDILKNKNLDGIALLNRMFSDCTTTIFPTILMMQAISDVFAAEEHLIIRGSMENAYFNNQIAQLKEFSRK